MPSKRGLRKNRERRKLSERKENKGTEIVPANPVQQAEELAAKLRKTHKTLEDKLKEREGYTKAIKDLAEARGIADDPAFLLVDRLSEIYTTLTDLYWTSSRTLALSVSMVKGATEEKQQLRDVVTKILGLPTAATMEQINERAKNVGEYYDFIMREGQRMRDEEKLRGKIGRP